MSRGESALRQTILQDALLDRWLDEALKLLRSGATAGSHYPEVWIRDLASFIGPALMVAEPAELRLALETFMGFQQDNGEILDGYTQRGRSREDYDFHTQPLWPGLVAHKNSIEADQESSLVIATLAYLEHTGDVGFLTRPVAGRRVFDRLISAMGFIKTHRWSDTYGLVWNGVTIDWGDVEPGFEKGRNLRPQSPRAIGIYTNALYSLALDGMAKLAAMIDRDAAAFTLTRQELHRSVRQHLWDEPRQKFIAHLYLTESPFRADFDEAKVYVHGGTGCAAMAGLLTHEEVLAAYHRMQANRREAGARSIGITVWPPYDEPDSPNPTYREPFFYQNAGDWPWFGSRMVLALIKHGYFAEAYEACLEIVEMIDRSGAFYEWYTPSGDGRGASAFRASAGVIAECVTALKGWAGQAGDL
ncbi:MAG: hypothetical protein AAGI68_09590 [Planctomycetota bacterium]